jgi:hypothetical protein
MDQATPMRRVHGAFAALVDVIFAFASLAILAVTLVAIVDVDATRATARLYARQLGLTEEVSCPAAGGNTFWFACAAEVRRMHPGAAQAEPRLSR